MAKFSVPRKAAVQTGAAPKDAEKKRRQVGWCGTTCWWGKEYSCELGREGGGGESCEENLDWEICCKQFRKDGGIFTKHTETFSEITNMTTKTGHWALGGG